MRSILSIIFLLFVFWLSSTEAQACPFNLSTASEPETDWIRRSIEWTEYIFSARVTSVEKRGESGEATVYTFRVIEKWKGIDETEITMSMTEGSPYSIKFDLGKIYLVYANPIYSLSPLEGIPGTYYTHSCMRTRPLSDAQEDLKYLGPGTEISAPGKTATKLN